MKFAPVEWAKRLELKFLNMDKAIFDGIKKIVGKGEKTAPMKSAKLKVKFGKPEVDDCKDKMAKKMKK